MYRGIWCGNLKERDHLKDVGIETKILKRIFTEISRDFPNGVICLRKSLLGKW
jgi:hypothetical protein